LGKNLYNLILADKTPVVDQKTRGSNFTLGSDKVHYGSYNKE